jgi:hypothetical protein
MLKSAQLTYPRSKPANFATETSLVSVAKGKIARQNRHFQRFSAASFACQWEP